MLDDCSDVKNARKWCRKQFGELEVIHKAVQSSGWNRERTKQIRPHLIYVGPMYDVEKNTWYNKVGGNPRAFHFKCPMDAIAFKLRWM